MFEKTTENVRKRINVELVNTDVRLKKVVAKPEVHSFQIFNPYLVGVHHSVYNLVPNKPVNVIMSILGPSKTLMYDFPYNYMGRKYMKADFLFTDTQLLLPRDHERHLQRYAG